MIFKLSPFLTMRSTYCIVLYCIVFLCVVLYCTTELGKQLNFTTVPKLAFSPWLMRMYKKEKKAISNLKTFLLAQKKKTLCQDYNIQKKKKKSATVQLIKMVLNTGRLGVCFSIVEQWNND